MHCVGADLAREALHRASPLWRDNDDLLQSAPGIGPVSARTLGLALPAWGTCSRQRLAALVGVAPCNRASGPLRGTRTTWGGRAQVRAPLYLRARVAVRDHPVRTAFDPRLGPAGQAQQVARTACMRKRVTLLNALVKPHKPWHGQAVLSAYHTRLP